MTSQQAMRYEKDRENNPEIPPIGEINSTLNFQFTPFLKF